MRIIAVLTWFAGVLLAGRSPHHRTGTFLRVTPPQVEELCSAVRRVLAHLAGLSPEKTDMVLIEPYLHSLTMITRGHSVKGLDLGRAELNTLRQFLYTAFRHRSPTLPRLAPLPEGEARLLEPWRPLYSVLAGSPQDAPHAERILELHDWCLLSGIRSPEELAGSRFFDPADGASNPLAHGLRLSLQKRRVRAALLQAYEALGWDWPADVLAGSRGLYSLPDLHQRLRAAGCDKPLHRTNKREIIQILAPKLSNGLERYLGKDGPLPGRSNRSVEMVVDATSHMVTELLRAGHDITCIGWLDVFERDVLLGTCDLEPDLARALEANYGSEVALPLIRVLAEQLAWSSQALSPQSIKSAPGQEARARLPLVTITVLQEIQRLYRITEGAVGYRLRRTDPVRWNAIKERSEAVCDSFRKRLKEARTVGGKKNRSLLPMLCPELVCIGLPALHARVVEAEARMDSYVEGEHNNRTFKSVQAEFDGLLVEYIALGTMIDDCRPAPEYAEALAGLHFIPVFMRDDAGAYVGIDQMEIRTTTPENGLGRRRYLSRGIIDHRLLFRYWMETRPRLLVSRGVLPSISAFDPATDNFAVFVGRNSGGRSSRSKEPLSVARQRGGLCISAMNLMVGQTLHWIAREVLQQPEIPAWEDPARGKFWRGQFGPDAVRMIGCSYWGWLRGDWGYASFLTGMSAEAMHGRCEKISSAITGRVQSFGPYLLDLYAPVLDRLIESPRSDDWEAFWEQFDPADPTAALSVFSNYAGTSARAEDAR